MLKPDGHNDWPCNIRGWFGNNVRRADFDLKSVPIGQTDLERLGRGRLGGQFWSAFVSWFVSSYACPSLHERSD